MKPTPHKSPVVDLAGYEVLVALSGGIAAYKVCEVVSNLVQRGCRVTTAMTAAAEKFVGPITFQALSGRRVLTSLWSVDDPGDVQHIERTQAADLMLIAPATANIIGKIAGGIADDIVSTLVISAASPVLIAPAMNERMWSNPALQGNLTTLEQRGFEFVGPGEGWLACGTVGRGRMAEPGEILERTTAMLQKHPPRAVEQG